MRITPSFCLAAAGTFVLASTALAGGPPNDNCEDRIPIFDGATPFSTVGATTDGPALPPECDEGFGLALVNDIWFNYEATCDQVITVSTCNAATYDTRLAAYTGDCGSLTLVACNDDGPGCAGFTSIMEWFGDEGTVYRIRVGGFGGSGTGTLTITCGAPGGSTCCFASGEPGCDDAECAAAVCAVDPVCCSDGWDAICAATALVFCEELCTGGGGGCPPSDHDCFTTGGPGCTDIECCVTVCAADPFCCDVAWDGICVGGAQALCGVSGEIVCPKGASEEGEPCGSDTNGGCNSTPPVFGSIACGETICGTAWATGATRDTDWFEVTFSVNTEVTFTGTAAFPLAIGIVDTGGVPNCALATALDPFATAGPFLTASFTTCLNPGTYWFFVAPSVFEGVPCGGENNDYVVTLTCVEGCEVIGCGSPDTGDCFVSNGSPFCDDAACCQLVCSFDPFCCDVTWDGICASGAIANCGADPITNDDCADAIEIFLGDTTFSTLGATTDGPPLPPGCDKGFGLSFVNDVWFSFVGTENDILTVSTCNQATFDTRLAAYTGDCGSLVLEECNDDGPGCATFTSIMTFPTLVGEEFLIRVGGFGTSGTGTLTLFYGQDPGLPNDNCDDAIVITDGVTAFSTVGATTDGPPLPPACEEGFGLALVNDVWYLYTPTCDGLITVSTCGSATYDTRIAAYSGNCDSLTLVACNDDGPGCGLTSLMTWQGKCGVDYLIRIGGFSGSGTGQLLVSCDGEPCGTGDPCPWDISGDDGLVDGADLGELLNQWGPCPGCSADFNNDGEVDGADLGELLNNWGACP